MTRADGPGVVVRDAVKDDVTAICEIVRGMAEDSASPITADYARAALERPGFGMIVAEELGAVTGLLAYSIRPNLWHAADACMIEILAVLPSSRGRGIGNILMKTMIDRMSLAGCAEITVTVDRDNECAMRLYRRHGLVEDVACFERHL
jgi:ribosomal protein S18 acetylase RimI-like enzyme